MIKKYIAVLLVFISSCATDPLSEATPKDELNFPISIELSKDENSLFVANTNFDLHYQNASLNLIDLDSKKIVENTTILTDSFLGDIAIDYDKNLLFTVSRENSKLYMVDISESKKLKCGGEKCDESHILELDIDAPNYLTLDTDKSILYIGHRNDGMISVVSYKDPLKLKILKQFEIDKFLGDISGLIYSKADDKIYVTSNYSSFLHIFRPLFDYYGRISKIEYFDKVRISNRNITITPSSESIAIYKDQILVGTTAPTGISILSRYNDDYKFTKALTTMGAPVKIKCVEEDNICFLALYDSKSISIIDPETQLVIDNIYLKKRVYDFTYSLKRKELYATLFLENSVLVIDMDKESPSYLKIKEVISNE